MNPTRFFQIFGVVGFSILSFFNVEANAQIPSGLQLFRITHNNLYEDAPRMNKQGQIVFSSGPAGNASAREIFLYDHGVLSQVTSNDVADNFPDINDQGQIVWSQRSGAINKATGFATWEIFMWDNGAIHQITNNSDDDVSPSINNQGHVVWNHFLYTGCMNADSDIYFYDGTNVLNIMQGSSNQSAEINDRDEIVWTQYDFCNNWPFWTSEILHYFHGQVTVVSFPFMQPQIPTINNKGQIATGAGEEGVAVWDHGVLNVISSSGINPKINDKGDVLFTRWSEAEHTWQAMYLFNNVLYQLSSGYGAYSEGRDINNRGEVVFKVGNFPFSDIHCLLRD